MSYKQFGFGDGDAAYTQKDKRLKLQKDERARISFLWWQGLTEGTPRLDGTPQFVGAKRAYIKGVGFFLHNGPEYDTLPLDGRPGDRMATIIVRWPLLPNGAPSLEAIREGGAEVMYLVIDAKKYRRLRDIHMEYPLSQFDLNIVCEEPNYQQLIFNNARESILANLMKDPNNAVLQDLFERARALVPDAIQQIGQTLTVDQIRAKLNLPSSAGAAASRPAGGFVSDAVSLASVNAAISSVLDD